MKSGKPLIFYLKKAFVYSQRKTQSLGKPSVVRELLLCKREKLTMNERFAFPNAIYKCTGFLGICGDYVP